MHLPVLSQNYHHDRLDIDRCSRKRWSTDASVHVKGYNDQTLADVWSCNDERGAAWKAKRGMKMRVFNVGPSVSLTRWFVGKKESLCRAEKGGMKVIENAREIDPLFSYLEMNPILHTKILFQTKENSNLWVALIEILLHTISTSSASLLSKEATKQKVVSQRTGVVKDALGAFAKPNKAASLFYLAIFADSVLYAFFAVQFSSIKLITSVGRFLDPLTPISFVVIIFTLRVSVNF